MLPDYMVPADFVVLDAPALTANGKLDRHALPLPDTTTGADEYVERTEPVHRLLCDLVAGSLRIGRVGLTDNFFHLGGDSIERNPPRSARSPTAPVGSPGYLPSSHCGCPCADGQIHI